MAGVCAVKLIDVESVAISDADADADADKELLMDGIKLWGNLTSHLYVARKLTA